ncbi:hypothetical protein WR25_21787 [Diploscapter pachys]|uniref:Uncharacterized protein n=1 Tax=Diploscapter pachys TaxID=2018661 RepID=A0A2A2M2D3_9BILA|nr:hypothetical protein WR25_21787 [Diploscapter pachys]
MAGSSVQPYGERDQQQPRRQHLQHADYHQPRADLQGADHEQQRGTLHQGGGRDCAPQQQSIEPGASQRAEGQAHARIAHPLCLSQAFEDERRQAVPGEHGNVEQGHQRAGQQHPAVRQQAHQHLAQRCQRGRGGLGLGHRLPAPGQQCRCQDQLRGQHAAIAERLVQPAATEHAQCGAYGQACADQREHPGQFRAVVAVAQCSLGDHRTDCGGEGGDHPRRQQLAEIAGQQCRQCCQGIQRKAREHGRPPALDIAQPPPEQHADREGDEVQRQGQRGVRSGNREAFGQRHQSRAVQGFGYLREHEHGSGESQPITILHGLVLCS